MPKTKKQLLTNKLIKKLHILGKNNSAINPEFLNIKKAKGKKITFKNKRRFNIIRTLSKRRFNNIRTLSKRRLNL